MALGALDLDPQENSRDLAGHLHRPCFVGQGECDGPVLVVAAGGRDQPRDDLIPGRVGLELLGQPVLERVEPHSGRVFVRWSET